MSYIHPWLQPASDKGQVTRDPPFGYVWSLRYIDAPVLRDKNTDADGLCDDERLYYLGDANMNVTCLVDAAGDAVERYVYDPYGKATILDGTTGGQTDWATDADQKSDVDNEILYCGYRFDPETGLYHVRHRHYHPTLGRWVQRDPAGYLEVLSLYLYCTASPEVYIDWSGTDFDFMPGVTPVPVPNYAKRQDAASGAALQGMMHQADIDLAQALRSLTEPIGGLSSHELQVKPDLRHPNLAQEIADTMSKMCPCFEYGPDAYGRVAMRVRETDLAKAGDPWPTQSFCCCYYKNLPACNLFLSLGRQGPAPPWLNRPVIPTEFGAQWQPGGPLRIQGVPHTIAEEIVHGVYGTKLEYTANAGAALVSGTAWEGGTPEKPQQQHYSTVDALDRMLTDLVTDKLGCKNRADFKSPRGQTADAVQAAQRFRDRVKTMRAGVAVAPTRDIPISRGWQRTPLDLEY